MKKAKDKTINGIPTKELFAPGHSACAGCGATIAIRHILKAAGKNTIVVLGTGCMEVVSTQYPTTSWRVPAIHGAFENSAAIASGIDTALKYLGKRKDVNVIVIAGDGGTYDIGMQSLSGAFERGHKMTYICYNNAAYMNTGIQRSGATPRFASTTTTPRGKKIHGNYYGRKEMPFIVASHGAYVATTNIAFPHDIITRVKKSFSFNGPSYIEIFTPCTTGWGFNSDRTIDVAKLAFETKFFPLFEIENGYLKITRKPSRDVPVEEFLKLQSRFKGLTKNEIDEIQKNINDYWERLLKIEQSGIKVFK